MSLSGFHCWFWPCRFKSSISMDFKSLCCFSLVEYRVACGQGETSTSLIPDHICAINRASACRCTIKCPCVLLSDLQRRDGDFCRCRLLGNTSVSMDLLFIVLHHLCWTAKESSFSSLGLMRPRHFIWPHYPPILHLAASFGHSFICLHHIYYNKRDVLNRQPSI